MLQRAPVLSAPDFTCPFKLAVDASDVAAGGVLLQEDQDGIDHPVCYFSRKFNKHQKNYSTIERMSCPHPRPTTLQYLCFLPRSSPPSVH